jgi:hypothetical protein
VYEEWFPYIKWWVRHRFRFKRNFGHRGRVARQNALRGPCLFFSSPERAIAVTLRKSLFNAVVPAGPRFQADCGAYSQSWPWFAMHIRFVNTHYLTSSGRTHSSNR